MRIAIYPGSFDPITNGHLDIIKRAAKLFDKLIVLVAINPNKKYRFDTKTRIECIKEATKDISNVEVLETEGLTINKAKELGACAIIRGLRVVSDFEYEWSYAKANEYIDKDIEMVFFMAHNDFSFISSSTINELYTNGIDIKELVPPCVLEAYKKK